MKHLFKINQPVFDAYAKEYVLITNGIGTSGNSLDFIPTEGIAIRKIGSQTCWTYRKINHETLSPCIDDIDEKAIRESFSYILSKKHSKLYPGRI